MKKRILTIVMTTLILLGVAPTSVIAEKNTEDIIILYENDVHCAFEGYSKLSALKKELQQTHEHVSVVSSGDFIQGSNIGMVSKGSYTVDMMNLVGYEALTIGNHEFDFHLSRLDELVAMMNTKPVCCNFKKISDDSTYFEPYKIVDYGDTKIAYVGIITPTTLGAGSPTQFKDDKGNFIYTFCHDSFHETVQSTVDNAISAGADYVIALTHVGDHEPVYNIVDMIEATKGIDVVLDAHAHNVIEGRTVKAADGNDVLLTSTGSNFEHIGKLTITPEGITAELIKTETLQNTDPTIDAYITKINEEFSELGKRKIAVSEVDLITHDKDGNRLVRKAETNLGDLIADAFLDYSGADLVFFNGGGIRAEIKKGDITFNDLIKLMPYGNTLVTVETPGTMVKDILEMATFRYPHENGSFPHLAGVTFSLNTAIESSVVIDEAESFVRVDGPYRVYNIKILNKETGEYEPLDLNKTYTFGGTSYFALEYGSGMQMLENAKVIQNDGVLDVEVLEKYIVETLGGVIGQEYAEVKPNITFTDGEIIPSEDESNETDAPTDNPLETEPTEAPAKPAITEPIAEKGGCGSIIGTSTATVTIISAVALVFFKKRKTTIL